MFETEVLGIKGTSEHLKRNSSDKIIVFNTRI